MVRQLVVCVVTAAVLAIAGPASSQSKPVGSDGPIIQAGSPAELQKKWCASDPTVEHILVLPASLFVDSEPLICEGGPYKLYRIIAHSDPDDFEYFLDPPFGSTTRLGCDGKAGRTMQTVALNCRPLKGSGAK